MDLQQEWQNMSIEINTKDIKKDFTPDFKVMQSANLLEDVFHKLKWKLRWLRIIDLPVLVAALFLKGNVQIVLVFVFFAYEITRYLMLSHLTKIKLVVDYSLCTTQVLKDYLNALKAILRIEKIFGYIVLPISAPTGLIVVKLYLHNTFYNIFLLPNFTIQLLVACLIGIPLILIANKMNNRLFAKPINDLNLKIKALAREEN